VRLALVRLAHLVLVSLEHELEAQPARQQIGVDLDGFGIIATHDLLHLPHDERNFRLGGRDAIGTTLLFGLLAQCARVGFEGSAG